MSPYDFMRLHKKVTKQKIMLLVKRFVIVTVAVFTIFLILNYIFPLQDKVEYTTAITDDRGELIHAYLTRDEKWRLKTELHEISPLLQKTIIAKEDQYFYYHPGINIIAVARAAMHNVFSGRRTSGASTITMQVARALEHRERNIAAKLIETFRALQLEWKYDKKEILQLYLNLVPYGGNIEGVKQLPCYTSGKILIIYRWPRSPHFQSSLTALPALLLVKTMTSSSKSGTNGYAVLPPTISLLRMRLKMPCKSL
jgi:penicillin-binding protein 1C